MNVQIRFILIFGVIFFFSCSKKDRLPTVVTLPVSRITWDSVFGGGDVIDDGGSPVISKGLCITSTWPSLPTIEVNDNDNYYTIDGSGIGSFTSAIKFIQDHYFPKGTFNIRAYATNKEGTAYGEVLTVYRKSNPPVFHSVKTDSFTSTSAIVSFIISVPGEFITIDEVDIFISNNPNAGIDGTHFLIPKDQWGQSFTIENLTPNTTYYIRGFSKNESGFAYSPEISLTTWEGELKDIEGNIYPIKTIGSKVWMIKNLTTSKFADGSIIANIQDNLEWNFSTTSARCTYTSYGKLYNFYAIADNRNLCPAGWHIPTDIEWKLLEQSLGLTQDQVDISGFRGTDEGGKLKITTIGPNDWKFPNSGATNSSGFSAPGGGFRYDNGIMTDETMTANFWTKSELDAISAWSRSLSYNNSQIGRWNLNKKYGLSVRCVKD